MNKSESLATTIISHLKKNNQYADLSDIVEHLQKEVYRSQAITVIAAAELTEEDKINLKSTLIKKWGEHDITITIDPTLLTGMIVRFKDIIIDMSGKQKLNQLGEELANNL